MAKKANNECSTAQIQYKWILYEWRLDKCCRFLQCCTARNYGYSKENERKKYYNLLQHTMDLMSVRVKIYFEKTNKQRIEMRFGQTVEKSIVKIHLTHIYGCVWQRMAVLHRTKKQIMTFMVRPLSDMCLCYAVLVYGCIFHSSKDRHVKSMYYFRTTSQIQLI